MQKTAVINVVGLTSALLGTRGLFLNEWRAHQGGLSVIEPVLPALTCTAQATYLTGKWPAEHGIVGNGWYDRGEAEVKMWKQSNHLVASPQIWDAAKIINPAFTSANMFWWYNMYSNADYSVTPRPQYRADGQKKPDCYSHPAALRDRLQQQIGTFPLFDFWGPKTSIRSSKWIADAAKLVHDWHDPTLMLVYLPHLDYCCQQYAPGAPQIAKDLLDVDKLCSDLVRYFEAKGVQPIVLSEYGITRVTAPVHINRVLRNNGYIEVREENGKELLDAGNSRAFALADHQIAHIYVRNSKDTTVVKRILESVPGIASVLDDNGKRAARVDHERTGELVALAEQDRWFSYYYWLNDAQAPDFARTVEIHRKPGYDPAELFFDPHKKFMMPRIVSKLIRKKIGFRTLMDVIPLDAGLVKGSHGLTGAEDRDKPVLIGPRPAPGHIQATSVYKYILDTIFQS